jgi:hypothetical protein
MKHNFNHNLLQSYTLACMFLFLSLGILSNLQQVVATSISGTESNVKGSNNDNTDTLDKGDFAEFFDFGTGIFAAILFALSLIAYKSLKTKRFLYVSIAFALFAIHVIVSRLNLFIPEIESSTLELILSIMEFVALALFFVAIMKKESVKTRTIST